MPERREIAVVDDDPDLRGMVEEYLTRHGYAVRTAGDGPALDACLAERCPHLVVLDVNMPGEDGLSVARRLRAAHASTGIILLTAMGDEASRVLGLAAGADDYVVKPFEPRELLARVRSVLRRLPPPEATPDPAEPPQRQGGREVPMGRRRRLDLDGRRLLGEGGEAIEISAMEFELLLAFARHPRQVLPRERLAELAHGRALGDGDRSVDVRVARLRKKIEADPGEPRVIVTVRGGGYVFEPDAP